MKTKVRAFKTDENKIKQLFLLKTRFRGPQITETDKLRKKRKSTWNSSFESFYFIFISFESRKFRLDNGEKVEPSLVPLHRGWGRLYYPVVLLFYYSGQAHSRII